MHGIEQLTKDGQGYVYWNGKYVEHFSYPPNDQEEEKAACEELAQRCRALEAWNFKVGSSKTAWRWSWYENWQDLSDAEQSLYHGFFEHCTDWYENEKGEIALVVKDSWEDRSCVIAVWCREKGAFTEQDGAYPPQGTAYHVLQLLGYLTANMGQAANLGTVYATTEGVRGFIKRQQLDSGFFAAFEKLLDEKRL